MFNVNLRDLSFSVKFNLNWKAITSFWSLLVLGTTLLGADVWIHYFHPLTHWKEGFMLALISFISEGIFFYCWIDFWWDLNGLVHKAAIKSSITFSLNICSMWVWRWKGRGKKCTYFLENFSFWAFSVFQRTVNNVFVCLFVFKGW